MRHHADSFGSAIAEQQRHADLHILRTDQEAEQARSGFVGAERLASENPFDDRCLPDAPDVDRVLKSLLDAFDAWVLDDNDCRLRKIILRKSNEKIFNQQTWKNALADVWSLSATKTIPLRRIGSSFVTEKQTEALWLGLMLLHGNLLRWMDLTTPV